MNLLPVETFDNIVIGATGKAWAVFELSEPQGMASYRFHSDAALVGYAHQILGWVRGLPLESRLLSVATPVTPDGLARAVAGAPDLISRMSQERRRALAEQAEEAGFLAEERPAHRRSHFLCVTLDSTETLRSSAAEALSQVTQLVGGRRAPSSEARRRELTNAADLAGTSLGPLVRPASQEQVRWLLMRSVRRGLPDEPATPAARRHAGPERGPGRTGRPAPTGYPSRPLLDATLIEGGERGPLGLPTKRQLLRVESASGCSYQTTLVLASMPPEWRFPDNGYWMAGADDFDFPVDVTVRILSPPQHETRKQFRRRHKELAAQPEQYAGTTTGVPDSVFELIDRSNAAQSALEGSRLNRIHRTLTCYTIAADDPAELERRVATVRAELGAGGYEVHAPTGDQRDLFLLGLPGTTVRPGGVVADYDLDLTAEAIASGLPGFTPALGDERGALLGHRLDIGPPAPVLLSPSVTTSASTMGFGASGGGKSFTAKTIAMQELLGGAQVVAIDRTNRGEYVQFATGLPGFLTSEVVDLSGETRISLCPMSTFPPGDRVEITSSFLCLLAGIGARTMESARIAQAVEYVDRWNDGTRRQGTTQDVLELLRIWGDEGDGLSRDLFYRITPLARTRFAHLAFQPGAGVSVQGADLIVLHARGLVLPSKEELRSGDDLDASKAASIAMVYLLMALADAIGNTPHRLSSIILDEAWAFLDSSFGIDLANRVLRDGRKDFKKLQLWSQHPADAPPDLLNMASNVFLTRQVEGAGATALRMVGAEPTPELVSMVEGLGVGEMVMRDEYGRLGVIHVAPPVDPRTARAFDTRPRSGQDGFASDEPAEVATRPAVSAEPAAGTRPAVAAEPAAAALTLPAADLVRAPEPVPAANPVPATDPLPATDPVAAAATDPTSAADPVPVPTGAATAAEAGPGLEIEPVPDRMTADADRQVVPEAEAGGSDDEADDEGLEIEPGWEPVEPEPRPGGSLQPHPVTERPRLSSDLFERLEASFEDSSGAERRQALDVASFVVPRD